MQLENKVKAVKEEKSYGHLNLNTKDCPFLNDASINDVVEMTITLKVNELRAPDQWDISNGRMKPGDITVRGIITKIAKKSKEVKAK